MKPAEHIEILGQQSADLLDIARRDLDAAVPTCPGWRSRDLVAHVGEVYAHKLAALRERPDRRPETWPHAPSDDSVVDYYDARRAEILQVLSSTDPATPVWTWHAPDQTAAFWARRMAQETVVHRVDADRTFGLPSDIPSEVALDGIDEFMTCFLTSPWVKPPEGAGTLAVRSGGRGWQVTLRDGAAETGPDTGQAQAVIDGEPAAVLLNLWGRLPDSAVRVGGDRAVYDAVRAHLAAAAE